VYRTTRIVALEGSQAFPNDAVVRYTQGARMTRSWLAAILVMPMAAGILHPTTAWAQDTPSIAGRWSLNRELSQFPREVGFTADWMSATPSGDNSTGGAGGSGSGGSGRTAFPVSRVSRDDATKRELLTAEVRDPSPHLTIAESATDITITPDKGASRTFHPAGREEVLQLEGVSVITTARLEGGRLTILYKVEQGRELRYTYSRIGSPPQLVVEVQFLERGKGDVVKRVYEPAREATVPASAPARSTPPPPAGTARAAVPAAADRPSPQDFDQRPDAQLKGLTKLGVVVEGLSAQAVTCGLRQDALESAVVKQLTGAGFKVTLNTDDDTYLYVNVMTATLANGLCVSRYDAYLYTHTTARLEYHETPVLVDVSLLHKGSIAAGSAAANGESVMRGLQDIVGQFTTRIRDANK
jgi:hypothetical protein